MASHILHFLSHPLRLAVGWMLGTAAVIATAQPVPTADHERLAQRIAAGGSVRLIVGLAVDHRPEGLLNATEIVEQRGRIRDSQTRMLGEVLAGTASRALGQLVTLPYVVAEVDAAGLSRLRGSSMIRTLEEDRLADTTLLQSNALIKSPTAWKNGFTGKDWNVAVLDTGVDTAHPFLAGRVVAQACFSSNYADLYDPSFYSESLCPDRVVEAIGTGTAAPCAGLCNHGTHVAGIAAGGVAPDGSSGVAKDAGIVAIQVFSHFPAYGEVLSFSSDQVRAMEWVRLQGASLKIAAVNLSLGSGRYFTTCDAATDVPAKAMYDAIEQLRSVGIATVVSTGNNGYRDSVAFPACLSNAVSVGAVCDAKSSTNCSIGTGAMAAYSNVASFMSLLAPGSFITSSVPGGTYAAWNGTSMAAPHVAGGFAVLKQARPTLSVAEAVKFFRDTGITVDDRRTGGVVRGMKRLDLTFVTGTSSTTSYSLTVSNPSTGGGLVSSGDGGISCGSACSKSYNSGTSVALTAAPAAGYRFTGWSGSCTGTALTCSVSMSANRAVTANFALANTLTVSVTKLNGSNGSVTSSPTGINCGTDCTEPYASTASVTLTAKPAKGSRFANWSGDCTGTATTCTVAMTQARNVTAVFTK